MPTPAILLIIATVLPLASFTILVFVGKRMGKPLAGIVGTSAIFLSFICSILAMIGWAQGGKYTAAGGGAELNYGMGAFPINLTRPWVPSGLASPSLTRSLTVGVYVDSVTIVMFAMVTLVATLVHVFSIAYMADDKRFPRFFTY